MILKDFFKKVLDTDKKKQLMHHEVYPELFQK